MSIYQASTAYQRPNQAAGQSGGSTFAKATPGGTTGGAAGSGLLGSLLQMGLANRGRKNLADIYRENRDYNKGIMDEAYARSLPKGVRGPAGMVSYDPDEEELAIELDPEIQAIRDGWLRAEQRAGEELAAYDMDERTIKQISLFDAANAEMDRRAQLRAEELAFDQGVLGGTEGYWRNRQVTDAITQRRLQEAIKAKEMAMGERNLLSAENLAFGNAAIESGRAAMQQADLARLIGQGSHTGVNAEGTSLASMALADTKAGFWSGLMGQANQYGGGPTGSSGGGGGLLSGLMKGFSIFN